MEHALGLQWHHGLTAQFIQISLSKRRCFSKDDGLRNACSCYASSLSHHQEAKDGKECTMFHYVYRVLFSHRPSTSPRPPAQCRLMAVSKCSLDCNEAFAQDFFISVNPLYKVGRITTASSPGTAYPTKASCGLWT